MTRFTGQLPLERITALDTRLRERLAARRADVQARLSVRRKPVPGMAKNGLFSTDVESDAQATGYVVGGLEVYAASAFNVTVSKGAMLCPHPGGAGHETRPGTFSGRFDEDDDGLGLYELAQDLVVGPSSPPASIVAAEWWAVVVTPELAAIESDSARKVFNKTTGAFDAASAQKVFHRRLVPSVVRGTGGGNISTVTIPAGATVIAWLYVHAIGETSVDNALCYDARRMPDPARQNRVGGAWTVRGQAITGEFLATLMGEELSLRPAIRSGVGVVAETALAATDVAEPGAVWPAGPGVAYLYLCRVRGTVPRLRGTISDLDSIVDHTSYEVAGMLVLSPKPPVSFPAGSVNFSERFDLRNDQTLTLPNPTHSTGSFPKKLALKFGGTCPAGEAICVGLYPYTALSGGLPETDGSSSIGSEVQCRQDGWVGGGGMAFFPSQIVVLTSIVSNSGGTQTGAPTAEFTFALSSAGKKLPIDGVAFQLSIVSGNADTNKSEVIQQYADDTNVEPISTVRAGMYAIASSTVCRYPTKLRTMPSPRVVRAKWLLNHGAATATAYSVSAGSIGYHLPYGVDLYTPLLGLRRLVGDDGHGHPERHGAEDRLDEERHEHDAGRARVALDGDRGAAHVAIGPHLCPEHACGRRHVGGRQEALRLHGRAEARQVAERPDGRDGHELEPRFQRVNAREQHEPAIGRAAHPPGDVRPDSHARHLGQRRAREGHGLGRHRHARREPQRRGGAERVGAARGEQRVDVRAHHLGPVGPAGVSQGVDPHHPGVARAGERPDARILGVVGVNRVDGAHVRE